MPPNQVNTGSFSPPLVTRETSREWRSLFVIEASSASGARFLQKACGVEGMEMFQIWKETSFQTTFKKWGFIIPVRSYAELTAKPVKSINLL